MKKNPFKPTAGAPPPLLVGRAAMVDEFEESLNDGPGSPALLTRISGPRGVGKTVLLTALADKARDREWMVLTETATSGLTERISTAIRKRLTPAALVRTDGGDLRELMGALLDELEVQDRGLLITVDEVNPKAQAAMRDIATTFQHLVTEERSVALVFAGLPTPVENLLKDEVLTFLRRAVPFVLEAVRLPDVRDAFLSTIQASGRTVTEDALAEMTVATSGYPFLIQLVGHQVWRQAVEDVITLESTKTGIPAARTRLGQTVHSTALADASGVDKTFLLAMSHDDGPSRTADIAKRMGTTVGYVSVYRRRLLDLGLIVEGERGLVDLALPYLREYLREHAAHVAMAAQAQIASSSASSHGAPTPLPSPGEQPQSSLD